jgi:hypothetical protein
MTLEDSMAKKSSSFKNSLGKPLTVYIPDEQKAQLQRMADQRAKQTGGNFSLTAMIRILIEEASKREEIDKVAE